MWGGGEVTGRHQSECKDPEGVPAGHVLGEASIAGVEGVGEDNVYFIFRYRFTVNLAI